MTVSKPILDFFVPGLPRPQGSHIAMTNPRTQRPMVVQVDDGQLQRWRKAIGDAARNYRGTKAMLVAGTPTVLTATFTLPRPKSAPRRVVYPTVKPDLDKLMRSLGDAVKGVIYADDSQTCDLHLRKRYVGHPEASPEPGVHVRVAVLLD